MISIDFPIDFPLEIPTFLRFRRSVGRARHEIEVVSRLLTIPSGEEFPIVSLNMFLGPGLTDTTRLTVAKELSLLKKGISPNPVIRALFTLV